MASFIEKVVVPLSVEVGHLVGAHKERYLEKLEIAGLDTDPYLLPPSVFTDLIKSPNLPDFSPHDLYHYVVNGVSPYTGADLKAFKSLDAYQFFVAGWVTDTDDIIETGDQCEWVDCTALSRSDHGHVLLIPGEPPIVTFLIHSLGVN